MSKLLNTSIGLALAASVVSLLPANADQCITRSTYITPAQTIQVVPQSSVIVPSTYMPVTTIVPDTTFVVPTTTTKTTKTTITTTPSTVIEPTILSTPDSVSRTVIMTGSAPATSSSSTITSADIGPFPVYGTRLAAMNEQIDRSLANGWITQFQANNLRDEASRLSQMIANRSLLDADTAALEHGLTGLNLSIQNAMKATGKTAGLNHLN